MKLLEFHFPCSTSWNLLACQDTSAEWTTKRFLLNGASDGSSMRKRIVVANKYSKEKCKENVGIHPIQGISTKYSQATTKNRWQEVF